jgi:hypothetical protein
VRSARGWLRASGRSRLGVGLKMRKFRICVLKVGFRKFGVFVNVCVVFFSLILHRRSSGILFKGDKANCGATRAKLIGGIAEVMIQALGAIDMGNSNFH